MSTRIENNVDQQRLQEELRREALREQQRQLEQRAREEAARRELVKSFSDHLPESDQERNGLAFNETFAGARKVPAALQSVDPAQLKETGDLLVAEPETKGDTQTVLGDPDDETFLPAQGPGGEVLFVGEMVRDLATVGVTEGSLANDPELMAQIDYIAAICAEEQDPALMQQFLAEQGVPEDKIIGATKFVLGLSDPRMTPPSEQNPGGGHPELGNLSDQVMSQGLVAQTMQAVLTAEMDGVPEIKQEAMQNMMYTATNQQLSNNGSKKGFTPDEFQKFCREVNTPGANISIRCGGKRDLKMQVGEDGMHAIGVEKRQGLFGKIAGALGKVAGFLDKLPIISHINKAISWVAEKTGLDKIPVLGALLKGGLSKIATGLLNLIPGIGTVLFTAVNAINTVSGALKSASTAALGLATGSLTAIATGLGALLGGLGDKIPGVKNLLGAVKGGISKVKDFLAKGADKILSPLTDGITNLLQKAGSTGTGFVDKLRNLVSGELTKSIAGLPSAVANEIVDKAISLLPANVKDKLEALKNGFNLPGQIKNAAAEVKGAAKEIYGALQKAASWVGDKVSNALDSIGQWLQERKDLEALKEGLAQLDLDAVPAEEKAKINELLSGFGEDVSSDVRDYLMACALGQVQPKIETLHLLGMEGPEAERLLLEYGSNIYANLPGDLELVPWDGSGAAAILSRYTRVSTPGGQLFSVQYGENDVITSITTDSGKARYPQGWVTRSATGIYGDVMNCLVFTAADETIDNGWCLDPKTGTVYDMTRLKPVAPPPTPAPAAPTPTPQIPQTTCRVWFACKNSLFHSYNALPSNDPRRQDYGRAISEIYANHMIEHDYDQDGQVDKRVPDLNWKPDHKAAPLIQQILDANRVPLLVKPFPFGVGW